MITESYGGKQDRYPHILFVTITDLLQTKRKFTWKNLTPALMLGQIFSFLEARAQHNLVVANCIQGKLKEIRKGKFIAIVREVMMLLFLRRRFIWSTLLRQTSNNHEVKVWQASYFLPSLLSLSSCCTFFFPPSGAGCLLSTSFDYACRVPCHLHSFAPAFNSAHIPSSL